MLNLGGMMFMAEENKSEGSYGNFDSLKERLTAVTNQIDAIKDSFTRSTEELAKIQSMLNIGNLDDITSVLEKYENRIAEAERKREEAMEGARKYSEELEKEKERLIKLWDAYKSREEELSNIEKKLAEYEERVRTVEASKKQMEEDFTARINTLEQKLKENEEKITLFDEYKTRCEEFDHIRNQLETEIQELKEENAKKEEELKQLNEKIGELTEQAQYAEYKEKYEEVNAEYEKEKERLTKLYHLYEETDAECKRLKEENKKWQEWYNSNREIFSKLFSTAPPVGTTPSTGETVEPNPTTSTSSPPAGEVVIDVENPEDKTPKKKRRFKFKK